MLHLLSSSGGEKASPSRALLLVAFVVAICGGVVLGSVIASPRLARAYTAAQPAACSNVASTKPGSSSLLIVLLDRSGSLKDPSNGAPPTDPQNYSASVTDALSDLWPGPMAVIPFYSNDDQLISTPIGPLPPGQRNQLKSQVDSLSPNGWTPLAAAMQAAQNVLKQNDTPAGSRIVVITDGQPQTPSDPDGQAEEQQVLHQYAPQFCQEGVPISPFGLTIPDNSNPARFLRQVAAETGGSYVRVSSAQELAGAVIDLYAAWDGLEFNQIPKDQVHGDYPIVTDSSVQSAYILTFYQSSQNESLVTANGQTVHYTATTDRRHYEIDSLLSPVPPATYTVRTADPNAIVYDLVTSTRVLQLIQPTASTIAYTGQTIQIAAHLVDKGTGPMVPSKNELTFFQATVTEMAHGQALLPVPIDLTQAQPGSDLFTGEFAVPSDAKPGNAPVIIGTLQIKVVATYQGVIHSTSLLAIPVVIPKFVPLPPPPPPPCKAGFWQCASPQAHLAIITGGGLLLLLLLLIGWLIWHPTPYGTLYNIPQVRAGKTRPDPEDYAEVRLGSKRTWQNALFHRSVITSDELSRHPDAKGNLDFDMARFELVARHGKLDQQGISSKIGKAMYIRPAPDNQVPMKVKTEQQALEVVGPTPLKSNSIIIINGVPRASYS